MEVSRDSVDLKVAFDLAALLLVELLLDPHEEVHAVLHAIEGGDAGEHLSRARELLLEEGARDVDYEGPHDILDIKGHDVAGQLGEHNVDVDVEAVVSVRDVY